MRASNSKGVVTRIAAVGDVMLGDDALLLGSGVRARILRHGPDYPFNHASKLLRDSDICFCNLECVLSDCGADNGDLNSLGMRGVPGCAPGLARAGFDVVSLANNHVLDHGTAPLEETASHLAAAHLLPVSGGPGRIPETVVRNNTRFGFLAYCLVSRGNARPPDNLLHGIENAVRLARARVDCLTVSLHWGAEYMPYPSSWQVACAHRLVDAGATLILGHHPHVLQPLESYERGLIAYSLGNFVFDMRWGATRHSAVLLVNVASGRVLDWTAVPVTINREYQPVMTGSTRLAVMEGVRPCHRERGCADHGLWRIERIMCRMAVKLQYRATLCRLMSTALIRYPSTWRIQLLKACVARRLRHLTHRDVSCRDSAHLEGAL